MITLGYFREAAFSLPGTEEVPHFGNPSFRINKRIYATCHVKDNRAMVVLPEKEQSVFCDYDPNIFFPANGAWGKMGATMIEMKKVRKDMFKDALQAAYHYISSGKGKK